MSTRTPILMRLSRNSLGLSQQQRQQQRSYKNCLQAQQQVVSLSVKALGTWSQLPATSLNDDDGAIASKQGPKFPLSRQQSVSKQRTTSGAFVWHQQFICNRPPSPPALQFHRSISKFSTGRDHPVHSALSGQLNEQSAKDLISNLKDSERQAIKCALEKYEAVKTKENFEAENACVPATKDLWKLFVVNAVPFMGFGFLDNFAMIVAGDYFENFLGSFMCISTMAAAGLGNTFSDVLGIGTAVYIERGCELLGLRPPDLTPGQLDMKSSRRAANYGRGVGIVIGCLIGMSPLLFLDKPKAEANAEKKAEDKKECE